MTSFGKFIASAVAFACWTRTADSFRPSMPFIQSTAIYECPSTEPLHATVGVSPLLTSHFGPFIPDWSRLHVPTKDRPYGMNQKIVGDRRFQSIKLDGVVTSLVWPVDGQHQHQHPERRQDFPVGRWLNDRPNLGIALSGGGMRAASTCLGWLRGLNELGLLSKARYVSSNSGATWVTLPLSTRQLMDKLEKNVDLNYQEFLGQYKDPQDITGHADELGVIGKILRDADILREKHTNNARRFCKSNHDGAAVADFTAWTEAIDENFVEPMGIDAHRSDQLEQLCDAYLWNDPPPRLDNATFPFPIFVGTAYPQVPHPDIAVPFEFTPLYMGIPLDPRQYNNTSFHIGGGYIQSVAMNSNVTDAPSADMPNPPQSASATGMEQQPLPPLQLRQLPRPNPTFKVADITGISSSFFVAADVQDGINLPALLRWIPFLPDFLKQFPNPASYDFWSPTSGGAAQQLCFADGGLYDNTGVLGLLRRSCDTIICCVSSNSAVTHPDPTARFSDMAALFGRAREDPHAKIASVNEMQVFASDKWDELVDALRDKYRAGQPQVCHLRLDYTANAKAGVYQGGTADVYFCVNGRSTKWLDQLQHVPQLQKQMTLPWWRRWWHNSSFVGPESMLGIAPDLFRATRLSSHFPYFSTFRVIYDQDVVNMMAHNSAYAIKTGLEELGFPGARAVVEAAAAAAVPALREKQHA